MIEKGVFHEQNMGQNGRFQSAISRIAEQASRTPNRVAVRMATGSKLTEKPLTYAQLLRQVDWLAHHLVLQGVQPQQLVGICLDRSLEMVVALLAILKTGAAYLPLDPALPNQRLRYLIDDARPTAVLVQRRSSIAEMLGKRAIFIESLTASASENEGAFTAVSLPPNAKAYTIYTSGSTGRPKGVNISHEALSNFLLAMTDALRSQPDDGLLAVTTLSFDIAVLELLLPLTVGGRVIVADDGMSRTPKLLAEAIAADDVTMMQATPSMWRLLLETEWAGKRPLKILSGGEPLPPATLLQLLGKGSALWNLYGPTETTIWSTMMPISGPTKPVPIGTPILETDCYVLDEGLHPLPANEVGELYIGGLGVAQGYHERPALTAEKFIPNPFAQDRASFGSRLYKTGDLASLDEYGILYHHGRGDHQIKIRGHRVELGEIEAVLTDVANVQTAVVHPHTLPNGGQQLIAYYQHSEPLAVEKLRETLATILPIYMIPAHFVQLETFPLTPNGKIDRQALPAPTVNRDHLSTPFTPPHDLLHKKITAVWESVLGLSPIGIHDNFFALGGDSLQAAIIIGRLQKMLNAYLYVVALFESPTVAKLAAYLQNHYPREIARLSGTRPLTDRLRAATNTDKPISQADLSQVRAWLAEQRVAKAETQHEDGQTAVFLLSPPRSGSTLLRVMLGGHSQLIAPPELDLLTFDTLGKRARALQGQQQFRAEGLLRLIMALRNGTLEQARSLMAEYEQRDISTGQFYKRLQQKVAPRRLVDKSVLYSLIPGVLPRMESVCANPFYIHLVRHPAGMMHSFHQVRLDRLYFPELAEKYTILQLAELIWTVAQQNITRFLQTVPPERQMRLRFEDLVQRPEESMRQIALMLGIVPEPLMWQPYAAAAGRLTDGLYEDGRSRMVGDVRFHEHQRIDPAVATRWQGHVSIDRLSAETAALARDFGYLRPEKTGTLAILDTVTSKRSDTDVLYKKLDDLSDDDVALLLDELIDEKNDLKKRRY